MATISKVRLRLFLKIELSQWMPREYVHVLCMLRHDWADVREVGMVAVTPKHHKAGTLIQLGDKGDEGQGKWTGRRTGARLRVAFAAYTRIYTTAVSHSERA